MNLARSEAVASSVYVADQSLRMKENSPGRAKSQNCQFELVVCSVAFPTTRNLPLSILLQSLMSVSCLLVFCPLQLPLPTTLNPSAQRFIIGCVVSLPRHSPSNSCHPFPVLVQWICTSKGTSFQLSCFFVFVFFFFVVAKWWGLVASFAKGFFDWNWGAVEVVYWNSRVVVC